MRQIAATSAIDYEVGDILRHHFGIGVARKGWLTRDDVVNCLPLGKIEREHGQKRGAK